MLAGVRLLTIGVGLVALVALLAIELNPSPLGRAARIGVGVLGGFLFLLEIALAIGLVFG